jgi:hypothetical protein
MRLSPEPVYVGAIGTDKTGSLLIDKIQIKKGGHGRIQLCPGFYKLVIFTNGAEQFPVFDHDGIRLFLAKTCHKQYFVQQTS